MRIIFILESQFAWQNGIWFHRNHIPSIGLQSRGHGVKFVSLGGIMPEQLIDWPDAVIFGRTYHPNLDPVGTLRQFKAAGKRVIYDIDDDLWTVNPDNPSVLVSSAFKDQYEQFIKEADAIITPSKVLAKKVKKLSKGKDVFICHNAISTNYYKERPKTKDRLIIGYTGAASHWKDLDLIVDVLLKLRKKHDFVFTLFGMISGPLEAEMYTYNQILLRSLQPEKKDYFQNALDWYSKLKGLEMYHVPFYPPEMYPDVLAKCDFDIGLAPLQDNEFNRGKSCIKFYEYASVGTPVLASDVMPYSSEVSYRAKNTVDDWCKKLEKLIVDKKFRLRLAKQQQDWVMKNRTTAQTALGWELACQRPGGLKVLTQQK